MAVDRVITGKSFSEGEENFNVALRPKLLDECIGQENVKEKLAIAIAAAKQRNEPLEHILFYGPPGLGKPRWPTLSPMRWVPEFAAHLVLLWSRQAM